MKKIALLFGLLVSVNVITLSSQTVISAGTVSGTWTLAGSPYLVQGNILVLNDSTLIIQSGVVVNFQGYYKLNVQGRLLAVGTTTDSITFTASNTNTGWKGIRFDNTPQTNDTSKINCCKIQYAKATGTSPDNYGGGLYLNNASKVIVSNTTISNCKAARGAAIYIGGFTCSPQILSNTILYNTDDTDGGGAIFCYDTSNPLISGNTISYNSAIGAGAFGGGITCSSSPVISNNTITNNTTSMNGGGINCMGCHATVTNNTIANNTASTFGGGIYSGSISYPVYINNIVSNNNASKGAGFFFTAASNDSLMDNVICNNTASADGGGIYCQSGSVSPIVNNTLVNNSAVNGGGLYCDGASNPKFKNCIVYGNTASILGNQILLYDENSDPSFTNCDIQGGLAAVDANGNFYAGIYQNNINSTPQFLSPSGGSGSLYNGMAANWALQQASPCVDAGSNFETFPDKDIAGNARVAICIVDIGAYEYQSGTPFAFNVTTLNPIPCFMATNGALEATVTSGTPPYTYLWSNGQTNAIATGLAAGDYSVTVTETNSGCVITKNITLAQNYSVLISPDLGPDQTITCGNNAQLNVITTYTGTGTLTFNWMPTSGLSNDTIYNPTASVMHDTKYIVTVTTPNGCVRKDSVMILVNPFVINAGADKNVVCDGLVQLDSVTTNYSGSDTLVYHWWPTTGLNNDSISRPTATTITDIEYHVTLTSASGCVASDSLMVHVTNLTADAGLNKTIVCGATAQLDSVHSNYNGNGQLIYNWHPSIGLNDSTSAKPTSEIINDTLYSVVVSTPNGCTSTDTVSVHIVPLTANAGMDKSLVCGGSVVFDNVLTNYMGSGQLSYNWQPTIGLNDSTISNPTAKIISDTIYYVTVTTPNGCIAMDSVFVGVSPLQITSNNVSLTCGSTSTLNTSSNYTGNDSLMYSWFPTTGLDTSAIAFPIVTVDSNQTYTVTLTTPNGCVAQTNVLVNVIPMDAPEICIVGVDSSNKNLIVWNKTPSVSIDSFYVYRETNVTNVYQKIGAVNYDSLSVFADITSLPSVQSNKYKLSVKDKCGLESNAGTAHKTMHLAINQGQGTTWNLIWDGYEGFTVSTYNVYRGTSSTNLQLIGTSSGSNSQYSDISAPAGDLYYQVEVVSPNSCNPTRNYNSSRSNIASTATSGIFEYNFGENAITLYPNPTQNQICISGTIAGKLNYSSVQVLNIQGQEMLHTSFQNQDVLTIDSSEIPAGVYIVKVKTAQHLIVKRFTKQ